MPTATVIVCSPFFKSGVKIIHIYHISDTSNRSELAIIHTVLHPETAARDVVRKPVPAPKPLPGGASEPCAAKSASRTACGPYRRPGIFPTGPVRPEPPRHGENGDEAQDGGAPYRQRRKNFEPHRRILNNISYFCGR